MARRFTNLDPDALRTFVHGVELGGFGRAAERLSRSPSAVSAQLRKLEAQVGAPLTRKAGRGLALTESGEVLLAYARRLLALNDEAVEAVRGSRLAGRVRLGVQEDFGEAALPSVLGAFGRAHPNVRTEVRVARNAELLAALADGRLDLALTWGDAVTAHADLVGVLPMRWIAPRERPTAGAPSVPLVAFEAPCLFRSAATAALDAAGTAWHVPFTGSGLGGLWAAVAAGLGVTARTALGVPPGVAVLDGPEAGLPPLPRVALRLHRADATPTAEVARLAELLHETLAGLVAGALPPEPNAAR